MRGKKRPGLLITEFVVQVYDRRIDWGGLDSFLWWLLHHETREGFRPHAARINRLAR